MAYTPKWTEDPSQVNDFELRKVKRDGLDIIEAIYEYAKTGYDSVPVEEFDLFKWAGVYRQRPNDGHFMMRVRIPSGILNSNQARVLSDIGNEFGRGLVDVTTRQAVQFHWLTIETLPVIFDRLREVGLSSAEACGDCPRTIVGNPLAGIDPNELMDTSELAHELDRFFLYNRDFSNLPRKYKVAITANVHNSINAEINDLAFTPAAKVMDGKEVIGFHVMVGGGLSTAPHLAQQLDIFVRPEEVVKVAAGITGVFRDYGYRKNRNRARLKFLVADWGVEKFLEVLKSEYIGEFPNRGEDKTVGWNAGYFTGVHQQKQVGLNYVGLSIPVGRMNADELAELARLADEYGDGSIRTSNTQNIVIPNIPDAKLEAFLQEPLLERITPQPKTFTGHAVSCTGTEFCNLAVVETKERMRLIAEYLDEHVELDTPVRLHVSGCPRSCGQPQIADIGLQGAQVKTPDGSQDAYTIALGGILGPSVAAFNTKLKGRVLADETAPALARLIEVYKGGKSDGESFNAYFKRVGLEPFQKELDAFLAESKEKVS